MAIQAIVIAAGKAILGAKGKAMLGAMVRDVASGAAVAVGWDLYNQVAEWARSIGADWDSTAGSPFDQVDGCQKVDGFGTIQIKYEGQWIDAFPPGNMNNAAGQAAVQITNTEVLQQGNKWVSYIQWETTNGVADDRQYQTTNEQDAYSWVWRIDPTNGSCENSTNPSGDWDAGTHDLDGCPVKATFMGFVADPSGAGKVQPVFRWTPVPQTRRAGGGVIRGCDFEPFITVGGGGDGDEPPTNLPDNPEEPNSDEWWIKIVQGIVSGLAGAIAGAVMRSLLTQQPPAAFTFEAPCDKDEAGSPQLVTWEWPQQDIYKRLLAQQAVLMEIMQQHLNWKTPTCNGTTTKGAYARSITFQSKENTERGNRRCTKRLGYRSNAPCELESLYEHWRDFTWDTGPVIVGHSGSALGSPQVWATSESEGKRVIRHAAGEAGIDPDQDGEWTIGGSDSPRYGVSHQVTLMEVRGLWQATAREGPDGYAQAVWSMPDP